MLKLPAPTTPTASWRLPAPATRPSVVPIITVPVSIRSGLWLNDRLNDDRLRLWLWCVISTHGVKYNSTDHQQHKNTNYNCRTIVHCHRVCLLVRCVNEKKSHYPLLIVFFFTHSLFYSSEIKTHIPIIVGNRRREINTEMSLHEFTCVANFILAIVFQRFLFEL